MKRLWLTLLLLTVAIGAASSSTSAKTKKPTNPEANHLSSPRNAKAPREKFIVPKSLQPAVDFWKMVYTKYDRTSEIFHDSENLGIIYSILDFSDLYNNQTLTREERLVLFNPRMDAEEKRIQDLLLGIHDKQFQTASMTKEEKRIYDLFKHDPNPKKFVEASDPKRIRAQTGIKNKFIDAIRISGTYLDEIEDIFIEAKLPVELTRMVFVESMFNTKVRSKVGASGIWQLMPTVGKLYGLTINDVVDERNDPILATHAALKLLKANYERLNSWPLAINAYNSGLSTMQNAVAATGGTDIAKIIAEYRGGVYGFASRNFYPSFLAALDIANHYPDYFGDIPRDGKLRFENYPVNNPRRWPELVATLGCDLDKMLELNPQYSDEVYAGNLPIPVGSLVRVPEGTLSRVKATEPTSTVAPAKPSDL